MLDAFRLWPDRAVFRRGIAYRYYDIERLSQERFGRLRLLVVDVDTDVRHGPNGQRMDPAGRPRSGRDDIHLLSMERPGQPLGHLTSRRVAGAEEENSFLLHGERRSMIQSL